MDLNIKMISNSNISQLNRNGILPILFVTAQIFLCLFRAAWVAKEFEHCVHLNWPPLTPLADTGLRLSDDDERLLEVDDVDDEEDEDDDDDDEDEADDGEDEFTVVPVLLAALIAADLLPRPTDALEPLFALMCERLCRHRFENWV